jgi:predicted  nucleic acid-binding Zn-ribbon protein
MLIISGCCNCTDNAYRKRKLEILRRMRNRDAVAHRADGVFYLVVSEFPDKKQARAAADAEAAKAGGGGKGGGKGKGAKGSRRHPGKGQVQEDFRQDHKHFVDGTTIEWSEVLCFLLFFGGHPADVLHCVRFLYH